MSHTRRPRRPREPTLVRTTTKDLSQLSDCPIGALTCKKNADSSKGGYPVLRS